MSVTASGSDRAQTDVVAVEGHVEGADGDGGTRLDPGDDLGQPVGQPHPARLEPDDHHAVEAVVALDDLVGRCG